MATASSLRPYRFQKRADEKGAAAAAMAIFLVSNSDAYFSRRKEQFRR
jgi:hypothetical protein